MAGRSFLDTNILAYAVDDADVGKRDVARELIAAPEERLVVSTQVLSEFYVVTTRKLASPLSEQDAARAVEALSKLPTVVMDQALVRSGIGISREARLSLWDGLILAAASAGGCDRVLTEDLADGASIRSVRVENPFR